jgi:hypothetical protein
MMRRGLHGLLLVVAACAAVLSFEALRDLALLCGFVHRSAPLLPLVIDAGAAAGTLAWLTQDGPARSFGRKLALVLLGTSVAGNAIGHALVAFSDSPPLILVVAVSGVAPAVLGAVVHLAVVALKPAVIAPSVAVEVSKPKPSAAKPAVPRRPKPATDDLSAKRARAAARKAEYRARKRAQSNG